MMKGRVFLRSWEAEGGSFLSEADPPGVEHLGTDGSLL